MTLPLEGIKLLDLSRTLPGPFCTMMLADMGAEVIKIDDPGYKLVRSEDREKYAAYDHLSRNKKSLALNLKSAKAREVFYKLAAGADVVVESFRPGVTRKLGVDYETLSALNPRVVYCSITAYGQDGPYRNLPAHDPNCCSIAGAVGLTGDDRGKPVVMGAVVSDVGSALHAIIGILCALRARDNTGKGQFVDISMTDSVLSFLSMSLPMYFRDGFLPKRGYQTPVINVWPTSDGKFITTANMEPQFWERFCRALGREDLIPFRHAGGEKAKEVYAAIKETVLTRTRDEWFQIMKEADACVTPVLELDEVVRDPQLNHRNMFPEFEHPTQGKVRQLGNPVKLSATPAQFRDFGPLPGQHTEEIMKGLGYSQQQIAELRKAGDVQ